MQGVITRESLRVALFIVSDLAKSSHGAEPDNSRIFVGRGF
jgi:hypothetical protein